MNETDFLSSFQLKGTTYFYYQLEKLQALGFQVRRLPFSIKVLVENIMRKGNGEALKDIAEWKGKYAQPVEIPYNPARVLMQDFTGVPAVVDLAAMRDVAVEAGLPPERVNPLAPVDLVVDHSVQVDRWGLPDALDFNVAKEYERNGERYMVLKWAQERFRNFNIIPPNSGICHQVNLEYLSKVVVVETDSGKNLLYPDTLVGTDSHTPMINGIGVMGWGVGGIEAEAVLMGQPYYMPIPEVVGVKMLGRLPKGVTATDMVLTITALLRKHNVVGKFVEYFGPGMKGLSLPDRATISNMTPEYGATLGFFPIDEKTLEYLCLTGREDRAEIVEIYARRNGFFYTGEEDPIYTEVLEFDLSTVEPSLAGPARPQDRIPLGALKTTVQAIPVIQKGLKADLQGAAQPDDPNSPPKTETSQWESRPNASQAPKSRASKTLLEVQEPFLEKVLGPRRAAGGITEEVEIDLDGKMVHISNGSVVIAAITSCTNTSNPDVMLGAGLLARNAVKKGLTVPPFVKTSLAPGSKVVMDYLDEAGLTKSLEALGFHLTAFGCTTCIGNSGPLHGEIEKAIEKNKLTVAGVLSGNRNFEARIHQKVRANFLASPLLVVAFALAGRVDVDLTAEPLGVGSDGRPVFLKDIWPDDAELEGLVQSCVKEEFYTREYKIIYDGDANWKRLECAGGATFAWDETSGYIKKPPFFENFQPDVKAPGDIEGARVLLMLGDTVTTDHISPAGEIPRAYPAGRYLESHNTPPEKFNTYGSRRGNHEVMMRGTFANVRIKNRLVAPKEGGYTMTFPEKEEMAVFDAAEKYRAEGTPLIVLGGKEYGTGSSRDWAAKGTLLLGVKAVLVESYERIHRSNLVGMGVLPLVFCDGENCETLGLQGDEIFSINGIEDMTPAKRLQVKALRPDGSKVEFEVIARLNTAVEVGYFQNGGILPFVLRKMLKA